MPQPMQLVEVEKGEREKTKRRRNRGYLIFGKCEASKSRRSAATSGGIGFEGRRRHSSAVFFRVLAKATQGSHPSMWRRISSQISCDSSPSTYSDRRSNSSRQLMDISWLWCDPAILSSLIGCDPESQRSIQLISSDRPRP